MRALATLAAAGLLAVAAAPVRAQDQTDPPPPAPQAGAPGGWSQGGGWRGGSRPPPSPEMRAARQHMREACAADFQRLCADATSDGGGDEASGRARGRGMMQCLREHRADFSPGCQQAISAMRAARGPGPGGPPPEGSPPPLQGAPPQG